MDMEAAERVARIVLAILGVVVLHVAILWWARAALEKTYEDDNNNDDVPPPV